jgi:transcriptional antiterminator Rof (Rho-off)
MYGYPIQLTMISNDIVEGTALDTQLNEFRAECIKVKVDGVDCLIELDGVAKLEICVKNPHFETINFNQ